MRRTHWTGIVALVAATAGGLPAAAGAASGPRATLGAYVAALGAGDARRVCALVDPAQIESTAACRSRARVQLRDLQLARVRIEPVLVRGAQARAVVDAVTVDRSTRTASGDSVRARVILRRAGGRWLVRANGSLPGPASYVSLPPSADPAPTSRGQALRRLADDELLALSGNPGMLCGLLAPGAPLGGKGGACLLVGGYEPESGARTLRLTDLHAHLIDAAHARLDVTIAVTRAVGRRGRPGYVLVKRRWSDELFAVRGPGRRWKLVKPSLAFYRVAGQRPPSDVATPGATATWPTDDASAPSLTETPMPPVCRTPPALWGAHTCGQLDALASAPRTGGGALVAWSMHYETGVRPVVAGAAAGPIATVPGADGDAGALWHPVDRGLISVAGGFLLVEEEEATRAVRVLPLDADGHQRGPSRLLDPGVENPDDGEDPTVAVGPPGASSALVVLGSGRAKRLAPDGSDAGATAVAENDDHDSALALLPDGSVMTIDSGSDGTRVRRLDAAERPAGPALTQPPGARAELLRAGAPSVAADAAGRLLIVWREHTGSRVVLRGWVYDPAAPTGSAPFTVAGPSFVRGKDEDAEDDVTSHPAAIAVAALPGGAGWGLAYSETRGARSALWAMRLDGNGTAIAPPRHIADRLVGTQYTAASFALAGDTLAWQSAPRVAGVAQVRSAPVP